jgi:hypothetical protein
MRGAAILAAAGLSACTALSGAELLNEVPCVGDCEVSLDAPAGGPDAAPEAMQHEAQADSSADARMDSHSPLDSETDAPTQVDATPDGPLVRWCSTVTPAPLFCEDFDGDNGILVPPWDGISIVDGGAVNLSSAQASSAPYSLYSTAPGGNGACNDADVGKAFAAPFLQADLSFDLFTVDTDGGLVAGIAFGPSYQVSVALGQSLSYVQQDDVAMPSFDGFTAPPLVGVWVRVVVHVALTLGADGGGPSSGTVAVSVGGSLVHTTAIDADKIAHAYGAPLIFVGVACNNHTVPRVLYFDNVVFNTSG